MMEQDDKAKEIMELMSKNNFQKQLFQIGIEVSKLVANQKSKSDFGQYSAGTMFVEDGNYLYVQFVCEFFKKEYYKKNDGIFRFFRLIPEFKKVDESVQAKTVFTHIVTVNEDQFLTWMKRMSNEGQQVSIEVDGDKPKSINLEIKNHFKFQEPIKEVVPDDYIPDNGKKQLNMVRIN